MKPLSLDKVLNTPLPSSRFLPLSFLFCCLAETMCTELQLSLHQSVKIGENVLTAADSQHRLDGHDAALTAC